MKTERTESTAWTYADNNVIELLINGEDGVNRFETSFAMRDLGLLQSSQILVKKAVGEVILDEKSVVQNIFLVRYLFISLQNEFEFLFNVCVVTLFIITSNQNKPYRFEVEP